MSILYWLMYGVKSDLGPNFRSSIKLFVNGIDKNRLLGSFVSLLSVLSFFQFVK